jgi:hypothetical protein
MKNIAREFSKDCSKKCEKGMAAFEFLKASRERNANGWRGMKEEGEIIRKCCANLEALELRLM